MESWKSQDTFEMFQLSLLIPFKVMLRERCTWKISKTLKHDYCRLLLQLVSYNYSIGNPGLLGFWEFWLLQSIAIPFFRLSNISQRLLKLKSSPATLTRPKQPWTPSLNWRKHNAVYVWLQTIRESNCRDELFSWLVLPWFILPVRTVTTVTLNFESWTSKIGSSYRRRSTVESYRSHQGI